MGESMKVLVAIKRVVDAYVKVRVKSDGTGVDLANAKMAINPFLRDSCRGSYPHEGSRRRR